MVSIERGNNFISKLFESINGSELCYAVLRNYKHLPESTGGSDLDIWVRGNDCERLISILDEVQKRTNSLLVSEIKDKSYVKRCYINSNAGIQIDIFEGGIYYQNYLMIPDKAILSNIRDYKEIHVLDDRFADLISLVKEIISNGRIDDKYVLPIYEKSSFYTKEYLYESLSLFSGIFIVKVQKGISGKSLEADAPVLKSLARRLIIKNNILYKVSKCKKLRRIFKPPGYVIGILGTDGSGKSTIINEISPVLNGAFHKGVRYEHLRPNLIPELGVLLGKREKPDVPMVVTDPHAQKASGLLGSLFRWGYYLIDYTFGYLIKIYPDKSVKNHVWIFDRCYYDYYLDQKRLRVRLPDWVVRAGEFFVPSPDIILCLGGDPQKIFERKPETNLKEVTRQVNALKIFCSKHKKAVWIDTCTSREESVRQAMTAICEMMGKRFANQSDK